MMRNIFPINWPVVIARLIDELDLAKFLMGFEEEAPGRNFI